MYKNTMVYISLKQFDELLSKYNISPSPSIVVLRTVIGRGCLVDVERFETELQLYSSFLK